MKEWTDTHVFNHPWSLMAKAAYRKYPNPNSSHVHSLDTVDRSVEGSNRLFSYRFFCTIWSGLPSFVMKLVTDDGLVHVREHSVCDLENKKLTLISRNVSLSSQFTMIEKLEYTVNKEDPSKTVLKQTASMDVFGFPVLSGLLENVWCSNYKSKLMEGREGLEYVAKQILTEEQLDNAAS